MFCDYQQNQYEIKIALCNGIGSRGAGRAAAPPKILVRPPKIPPRAMPGNKWREVHTSYVCLAELYIDHVLDCRCGYIEYSHDPAPPTSCVSID